jgi:hypothetical protein
MIPRVTRQTTLAGLASPSDAAFRPDRTLLARRALRTFRTWLAVLELAKPGLNSGLERRDLGLEPGND